MTENTIVDKRPDYFKSAIEYTAFYKKLAVLIDPYLQTSWDLADVGCGSGEIDIELAPSLNSITAIDTNIEALAKLDSQIDDLTSHGDRSAGKIVTMRAEADTLADKMWDVLLLCFYMVPEDKLIELIAKARERVILIVHEQRTGSRFEPLPEYLPLFTENELEDLIKSLGYNYRKEQAILQFGQPFKSIEDIHLYLEDYPERLRMSIEDRITHTGRHDFPYYLPNNFSASIFVIDV
jgi:SAM-dependent methyltransferase